MSNIKKTVRINEDDLVNLIDNIVNEAVKVKKKEWIAEQASNGNKTPLLESKILDLESKLEKLLNNK